MFSPLLESPHNLQSAEFRFSKPAHEEIVTVGGLTFSSILSQNKHKSLLRGRYMIIAIRYVKSYLIIEEAGEMMAQPLRALATLPEDLGSIPSTHITAHNCLQLQSHGI